MDDSYNFYTLSTCPTWSFLNRPEFHAGYAILTVGFIIPHMNYVTSMSAHALVALGHLTLGVWGLLVVCSIDVFGWNVLFFLLNLAHFGYFTWKARPVALTRELRDLYGAVFAPFNVSRREFKALCSIGRIQTLKNGECYAEEGKTPTGNLSIVLYGKIKVYCGSEFLHHILDKQFLDSPEWDAYDTNQADKFQVTLKATSYCKYLMWQREALLEFLKTNPFMRQIFLHLIGHDVAKKLTLLTERQWNHLGIKPDIRLSAMETEQL